MKKILTILLAVLISFFGLVPFLHAGPAPSDVINLVIEGNFKKAGKEAVRLEKRLGNMDPASAKFLLGYIKYKLGNFREAKTYFEEAKGGLPVVKDYAEYFLAESCLKLNDNACAVENFGDIIANYKESAWVADSYWGLAHADFDAGNFTGALDALSNIKPDDSINLTDSGYNLFKASVLIKIGRAAEALGLYRGIYFGADSKEAMDEAKKHLEEMSGPEAGAEVNYITSFAGQAQFAESLLQRQFYAEAVDVLKALEGKHPGQRTEELLADAYFRARDYKNAKDMYEKLASGKSGGEALHYLIRLAKSAARIDDFEKAAGAYNTILKRYPKGGEAALYRYKLGFIYMDWGKYDKAIEIFSGLAVSGYRGYLRKDILWNLAWCNYRLGFFDRAIDYFGKLADGGFGKKPRTRALYWKAVCLEKSGNASVVKSIYRDILNKDRFGYYGFLASKKLYNKDGVPNDWVIYSGLSMPDDTGFSELPAGLDKAKFLAELGLNDLALMEVKKFGRKGVAGRDQAISFMEFAREVGDFRALNLTAVERFKDLLEQFPYKKGLRDFVWKAWYPEAYPHLMQHYSKEFNIDGRLAVSIMREESRFQSDVVSRADAIGLMQIIPSTARRLAGELGIQNFETSSLYRPEINTRLGTKYLSDLSGMFDGEKVYMIASYNAGEVAVSRWLKNSSAKDIQEFIEEIPYDETNDYVKKVLKTYWIYGALH